MRKEFNIKYRPDIEAGRMKVETRDGSPARIVCWDCVREKEPIMALVKKALLNYEVPYTYNEEGRFISDEENDLDLFVVETLPIPSFEEIFGNYIRAACNYAQAGKEEEIDIHSWAADLFKVAELMVVSANLSKSVSAKPVEWSEEYREEDLRTRFAFYTYKDEDDALYLSNVFVEGTSRNKGFGTKILKAAEKVAETLGAISIRLKVKQDSPANAWYRKNGYGYVTFEDGYDWLEKRLEYMKPNKQEWSEADKLYVDECINLIKTDLSTASFESDLRRRLEKGLDLIQQFRFQQEQEWSEEDEKNWNAYIERLKSEFSKTPNVVLWDDINWLEALHERLKSLRPQPHWKPSEEQMEILNEAKNFAIKRLFNGPNSPISKIIESLYNDLKKL